MDFMKFLGHGSKHAHTAHDRVAKARAARQDAQEAAKAARRLAMIENVRKQWLDALNHDVMAIAMSVGYDMRRTLRGMNAGLLFASYAAITKHKTDAHVEVRLMRGGMSAIEQSLEQDGAELSGPHALSVCHAAETARNILARATPAEILQASQVFEHRHHAVMKNALA